MKSPARRRACSLYQSAFGKIERLPSPSRTVRVERHAGFEAVLKLLDEVLGSEVERVERHAEAFPETVQVLEEELVPKRSRYSRKSSFLSSSRSLNAIRHHFDQLVQPRCCLREQLSYQVEFYRIGHCASTAAERRSQTGPAFSS